MKKLQQLLLIATVVTCSVTVSAQNGKPRTSLPQSTMGKIRRDTAQALNYRITRKGFSLNWEKVSVPISVK